MVVNSMDTDGVRGGFDLELLNRLHLPVPVIASGGAGCPEDFVRLFHEAPGVDAGLAASVFHYDEIKIPDLKRLLASEGIPVRQTV